MASSNSTNISGPLAPLEPLHALVQLVPAASPTTGPASTSKHEKEKERPYILLTNLQPDAWVVHVGRPDGRWWSGAWRVADVKDLAVRISAPLPFSSSDVMECRF